MPDANEDTLPIQLPLRNITLDDNVMTLQFEQDEQFGGCFYIYDIKPD